MDFIKCNEMPKGFIAKRKHKRNLAKMYDMGMIPINEFNIVIKEEYGAYMGDICLLISGTFPERFRDYVTTKEECTSLTAKGYQLVEGPPLNKKNPDKEHKIVGVYCSNWKEIKAAEKGLNNIKNI